MNKAILFFGLSAVVALTGAVAACSSTTTTSGDTTGTEAGPKEGGPSDGGGQDTSMPPEDTGTTLAAAHRLFVNLLETLSSGDAAVVDEVERGEDHIKHKYEAALKDNDISLPTRAVIEQAYTSVKAGHDRARDLKHSLHAQS